MIGMMFEALQEQARKSGYMIFNGKNDDYVVADLLYERVVSIEPDIAEVADLLGGICVFTAEQRLLPDDEQKKIWTAKHKKQVEWKRLPNGKLIPDVRAVIIDEPTPGTTTATADDTSDDKTTQRVRRVPAFVPTIDENGNEAFKKNPVLADD